MTSVEVPGGDGCRSIIKLLLFTQPDPAHHSKTQFNPPTAYVFVMSIIQIILTSDNALITVVLCVIVTHELHANYYTEWPKKWHSFFGTP